MFDTKQQEVFVFVQAFEVQDHTWYKKCQQTKIVYHKTNDLNKIIFFYSQFKFLDREKVKSSLEDLLKNKQ